MKTLYIVLLTLFISVPTHAHHQPVGDLNNDGFVDIADFLIFAQQFGNPTLFSPHTIDTIVVRDTVSVARDIYVPDIIIAEGDFFGDSEDYHLSYKVFQDVQNIVLSKVHNQAISDIRVRNHSIGPAILYSRLKYGEYDVVVNILDNVPDQSKMLMLAFQFAHEYGHILMNYRRGKQKWFEESIAIAISYVVLKELKNVWISSTYKKAAEDIDPYLLSNTYPFSLQDKPDIEDSNAIYQWYLRNRHTLENTPVYSEENRERQKVMTLKILQAFELWPDKTWNAIRYINTWPVQEDETLREYLEAWFKYTPRRYQTPVRSIIYPFIQ